MPCTNKLFLLFPAIICVANSSPIFKNKLNLGSAVLDNFPLIDGHNDFPNNWLNKLQNQINNFEFNRNLSQDPVFGNSNCDSCQTDLERAKKGKLGAQFWVAYVNCQLPDAVSRTLEQIDVIKRFIKKYSNQLQFADSADGILEAFEKNKLASLIVVEGGHSIDSKMSILRLYYELGVRYLTLTHSCNLPWADASPVDANGTIVSNLTDFGKKVVLEMNRLGMMVDLSHVSYNVMSEALDVSRAPIIFSHSSAYAIHPHHRNVRDDILLKVKKNNGIVMVNFYYYFIGVENVSILNVIDHINHIVDIAGIDHVGIGSDFDGVNKLPEGLEDVSQYPRLFDLLKELDPTRWTNENLEKLAGRNLFRVFKQVENVRDSLSEEQPDESWLSKEQLEIISDKKIINI